MRPIWLYNEFRTILVHARPHVKKKRKAKQTAKSQTQESTVDVGWFSTSLQEEEGQDNDT